ncbi:MAG: efflux RND transporter permease subunit [Bacteroidales bacterium]|nr:efflux RND transporter permease subunit [Bacteroidales bacterium]
MHFIIKRKVLIAMLFAGLAMLGVFSYRQLPVELLPNTQIPYLFVQIGTSLEMDPKYIENQAVIPLEGAIGTLKGVEKIESTVDQQQAFIQISYRQNTNIKIAYLKLLEKVEEVKNNIPSDFYVQALRFDMEMLNNNLMTLQVRGGGGVDRVRQVVNRDINNRLLNVNGIANVAVFGGREKSVEIRLRDEICNSYGITAATIRNVLNQNSRARTFAGMVTQDNRMVFVNVVAEFSDLSAISELIVREQGSVRLKDVADIRFGYKNQDSYSRVNGKEAVTIQLTRDTQSNMIDLADRVKDEIAELNKDLSDKDIEIVIQNNSAERMERNINQIIQLALVGGILAIFILWIFLKNLRLVLAIGLAMPISIYIAFNFFYAAGISINSLTLLGMALAIGMLLDNSVVVMENIYRLASQKVDTNKAVIQGTTEVWRSIFAATLTTVMVFLPFAFSKNFLIAILGKHIGVSIISTLLVSLVVAMLLIPMITHTILKHRGGNQAESFSAIAFHNRLIQVYRVILKTCMRNPAGTALGALGVFFATLLISLGLSFIKSQEPEIIELALYVTMPGGTTLDNTDLLVADAEKRLENLKEKKDIISQIYEEEAQITIVLEKEYREVRNYSVPKIKQEIMNSLSGLEPGSFSWEPPASARRFGGEGGDMDGGMEGILGIGSEAEKVIIKGEDYEQLVTQANLVKYYLTQQQSVEMVNINIPSARPEVLLNFDKQIMALYDIQAATVLTELGSFPQEFSSGVQFKQGTEEYDIQIRTETPTEQTERNLGDLKKLTVKGRNDAQFELQNISTFSITEGAPTIKRVNQAKQLEVEYTFIRQVRDDKDLLTTSRLEVESLLSNMAIPSGVTFEVVHEQQDLSDFRFLILAALILIYMILASVFESFSRPVVILFAIPLAATGSLIALILTGNSLLNANTLTGFVILIGIVVNNGIILLDYANVLMKRGYGPSRSLMMAGLARVRPILITSITTIIALFPLAMGKAEYVTEIGAPFAITIIGGLGLSTLLTLVFIPTLNTGIHTALHWIFLRRWQEKLMIMMIYLGGSFLIFTEVDALVWKIIDFLLLIILTPATLYFVKNSLRKANEKLIDESTPLHIQVRNLVKIYDRDSRFVREWKSGLRIRQRLGLARTFNSWKDFDYLLWLLPLMGFVIYFIYFYLENGFWYFLLPVGLYLMVLRAVSPVKEFALKHSGAGTRKWPQRLLRWLYAAVYWGMPLLFLVLFYQKYKLIGLLIPAAVIWYLILAIKVTSDKLYREQININRLQGRFKGLRKAFYRLVKNVPLIGRKRMPFKALKGVSFNIEHGMFGLLGPNGAGKSTLMRIVCGILEPSYGQITINGIDTKVKREELQGLIGYLPQEFGVYENLTAWEFLNYMGILKKLHNREQREARIEYVLNAVHMAGHKHEKLGSYSGGMKQRIGIAQILLHLPRILVVDEPTSGLDPRERIRFRNLLVELSRDRIVIFSTHIIEDVASSCNQVAVVRSGELVYLGEPVEMAHIAQGKVWMADVGMATFETLKERYVIIHHMRDGDIIRVRCMADECPVEGAHTVKANLEDAYLCLLQEK